MEAHAAVVRRDDEAVAPLQFVRETVRRAVPKAHVGINFLLARIGADGGDEREDAHAPAHEGDALFLLLHIKPVAQGQEDGELFALFIVFGKSMRARAFELITHGDALALRLAHGDGTAQGEILHAHHAELPGAHLDLLLRRERQRIDVLGDAHVL